jgi:hypothetical protein
MSILRGLLLDNLGLKLVALLLALAVYLNVFTERPAAMVVSFPVEYTDLPDSLAIAGPAPAEVRAELRGTGKQFIRLWLTEPRFKVSLAGARAGRFVRPISPEDLPIIASDKISVQRVVEPERLDLRIERAFGRRLPVAARVEGAPKAGWSWTGEVLVDPPTVLVRGPQGKLAELDSVRLQPVSLAGGRDTVRVRAEPDTAFARFTFDPAEVTVRVPLARR